MFVRASSLRVGMCFSRHNYAEIKAHRMTVIREVRSEAALSPEKNRNSAALSWFGQRFGALPGYRRDRCGLTPSHRVEITPTKSMRCDRARG